MNQNVYREYLAILREEIVPALGCTEPIAIAYAAAKARSVLGRLPEHIDVRCSGNIIKNVKAVIVPTTGNMKGIETSAVLGAVGGNPDKKLEVLTDVSPKDLELTWELLRKKICSVSLLEGVSNLQIIVEMTAGQESALVEIAFSHTNIVRIEHNGTVVMKKGMSAQNATETDRSLLNLHDIYDFANTVDIAEVGGLMEDQVRCNMAIARQIKYGTNQLFILGSAGEVTLLSIEEKKLIVKSVIAYMKDRAARGLKVVPVFFSAASFTTEASVEFAQFCEAEGADGVVFTVPPYVLITQHAAKTHLDTCMSSVSIPCGIYNNPSRLGVQVLPETIKYLSEKHPNFVVDKEAMPSVEQLVQVQRLCEGKVKIMCCDYPHYSIVIPTLAIGGTGTANIGGNIIPEEAALYSRPWTDMKVIEECRTEYFKWFPLLQELYTFSNPIVIKAALNLLGLPGGHLRKPYEDYSGEKLEHLKQTLIETGVMEKYHISNDHIEV